MKYKEVCVIDANPPASTKKKGRSVGRFPVLYIAEVRSMKQLESPESITTEREIAKILNEKNILMTNNSTPQLRFSDKIKKGLGKK